MTQQTMTKEQILETYHRDEHETIHEATLTVMELYAQQEVAKEREKAKKLVEALEEIYLVINELELTDTILPKYTKLIKQSLTEYENNH